MCKEIWCQIRAGENCEGKGNCLKYLQKGWNRKGGRNKDFKKREKLGQGVRALKRSGLEPLYELWFANCNILNDQQKAFDTINHEILLKKLEIIGFSDKFIQLFQ